MSLEPLSRDALIQSGEEPKTHWPDSVTTNAHDHSGAGLVIY